MQSIQSCLGEVIGGIGAADFPGRAAKSLGSYLGFDLSAVVLHPRRRKPRSLFHNFDQAGYGAGVDTYVRHTYRANPMLRTLGAVRACDFAGRPALAIAALHPYLVQAPDEELGYRTAGWPESQEEIGLYVNSANGLIELGFYRPRGRIAASDALLRALEGMAVPITAAFERDDELRSRPCDCQEILSLREREICGLMLAGCSSDAIALQLGITRHTVKDHRKNVFRKLEVGSLAQLFAKLR